MRNITAIINGYGVPKDILTDANYHAYLVQVVNFLFDRFKTRTLTVIPTGGNTDMRPPYKRTEAGEMARWLRRKIKLLGLQSRWRVRMVATELSALENMLACKSILGGRSPQLYFCEKTRERKMKPLARKIFGPQCTVVGVEFDGSPPRYDARGRGTLEREDLTFSLRALKDGAWRRMLRTAAEEKIRVLRNTPESVRAREVDRITRRIRKAFFKRYVRAKKIK